MAKGGREGLDPLLSVRDAATLLSVKPTTLYRWANERRLAKVKLGSALRFRQSELERFVRAGDRPALRSPPLTEGNV
jgi:excisionase family DNA binding protein